MDLVNTHLLLQIVSVAVVGGLIGLDRTAAGQFMISQPIVAGPLVGWLFGDISTGLVIGALLELIWVLDMPVGAFVPADATIGTVSATAIAVLGSAGSTRPDVIGFCIILTTGMVQPTMLVDRFVRNRNARLAERAIFGSGGDVDQRLSRLHLTGLMAFFLKSFVLYLIFVPVGLVGVAVFEKMPEFAHKASVLFVKLLPFLGAALVVRKLSIRTVEWYFLAGFVIAAGLTLVVHTQVTIVVLCIVAVVFLKVRLGERREGQSPRRRKGNEASG